MKYYNCSGKKLAIISLAFGTTLIPVHASTNSEIQAFGVIDLGFSHYKVSGQDSLTALSDSGNTTSRLGFRGSENLGNGLKAIFWLEGGLNPSAASSTYSFARRSIVGISGDFGEVTLGREYTPGYSMHSTFGGPFGTNGVGENILYRARVLMHDANNAGQEAYVRSSNAITYISPLKNGIYGQFMYGFDEQTVGHAGQYLGGRIGYTNKQIDISAAYNIVSDSDSAPASTPRKIKNIGLGASYKFAQHKIVALYVDDRINMLEGDKKLQGLSLGLESKIGAGAIRAGLGHVNFKYADQKTKAMKYSLGYVHHLSKRTALYTSVAYIDNKGTAFSVSPSIKGKTDSSSSGIDFGMRHHF